MALWLWRFWLYSFFGYLLEKAFAVVIRAERRGRKCFLLLPLCPVYGLGVLGVLALPEWLRGSFFSLALWGGLAATAVEYAVHWLYEWGAGVYFWDYSAVPFNLRGRVCLPFSLIWGLLLAAALPAAERYFTPLLASIPPQVTFWTLLVFTADTVCSLRFLQVTQDVEGLRM